MQHTASFPTPLLKANRRTGRLHTLTFTNTVCDLRFISSSVSSSVRLVDLNGPWVKRSQPSLKKCNCTLGNSVIWVMQRKSDNNLATYATVSVIIKYLRWQRIALRGLLFWGDVFVHPLPLFFWHCDIHFLKLYLVGFQKSNHILLLFLYLQREDK